MQEQYRWNSGIKRLSKSEIRKMKENMQKTPLIQKKAEQYHRLEGQEADKLLEHLEYEQHTGKKEPIQETKKKIWFFKQLKLYFFWK